GLGSREFLRACADVVGDDDPMAAAFCARLSAKEDPEAACRAIVEAGPVAGRGQVRAQCTAWFRMARGDASVCALLRRGYEQSICEHVVELEAASNASGAAACNRSTTCRAIRTRDE